MKYSLLTAVCFFLISSCASSKVVRDSGEAEMVENQVDAPQNVTADPDEDDEIFVPDEEDEYIEERTLDELVVTAPRGYVLPETNPAAERKWDLIHMDLDVRFDWINEHVIGRADLELTPFFYNQNTLTLDAKGFEILDISDENGRSYTYDYDGAKIDISLAKTFERDSKLRLTIDYIAKPSEGNGEGSQAITSSRGLFFINPRGEDANKPQQIWTQGETEHNSRWFPTIDKPNENMTHDIMITVEDRFVTLSNGELISSKKHANNTRTDHWKMTKPHAPYLTMIAVGDFAVVKEEVDGILLEYYVEPEYEAYAKQIFEHTPEMIRYFSDLLDYPYPWNKFSQIITKDYVSGAMENTTAVIYGDFIQKTDRELIDDGNDWIIAHELFHHWFGDLVTVESWANLTLQEGFANYSEHLWQDYKYGPDAAGYQRSNEKQGYLQSILQSGGIHPLIHYEYKDKEDMFDGHSYNKGGLVLHMLRHEVGDDAFYAALNQYLTRHVHTAVEVDELRMAFEDVTGRDLHWFFDQWYLSAGHPMLNIDYSYDETAREIVVSVEQTQDTERSIPIFQLPVTIAVYNDAGEQELVEAFINKRTQDIRIAREANPSLVVFDIEDHLLYTKTETKTTEEYMNQYLWVDQYIHRFEAINKIKSRKSAAPVVEAALDDAHFTIRRMAVENVRFNQRPDLIDRVEDMAKNDVHSAVRGAAIKKLRSVSDYDLSSLIQEVLAKEQAYQVIGDALETLNRIDPDAALSEAVKLKSETTPLLTSSVSGILSESGDPAHLPYFEQRLTSVNLFTVFNFYEAYYDLLAQADLETIMSGALKLSEIALDGRQNMFYRFTSTNVIHNLKSDLQGDAPEVSQQLGAMIGEIKERETNELLRQRYMAF